MKKKVKKQKAWVIVDARGRILTACAYFNPIHPTKMLNAESLKDCRLKEVWVIE